MTALLEAYTSLLDVPLDEWAADEPDRPDAEKAPALLLPKGKHVHAAAPAAPLAAPAHLVVPFTRVIKLGSVGRDVVGAKRAIWRALGLKVPANATETFGATAAKMLRLFQELHRLPRDGELGPATLAKLGPFFDDYAFLLYEGYRPGTDPVVVAQQKFIAYALWGYRNRERIHYAQLRPMDLLGDLQHLDVWNDCSEFFTKAAKYAGMHDPNNMRPEYDGYGWTGTLGHNGRLVSLAQARVGDAVLYGSFPDFEHVALYIGGGRVISHGSEAGPLLLSATYRPIAAIHSYWRTEAKTELDLSLAA